MYDVNVDWKRAFIIDSLQIASGEYHSLMLNVMSGLLVLID